MDRRASSIVLAGRASDGLRFISAIRRLRVRLTACEHDIREQSQQIAARRHRRRHDAAVRSDDIRAL